MKLSIDCYSNNYATVTFSDGRITYESSLLDPTERANLANNLREVADVLSPGTESDFNG
jgi:hypothetical protein